MLYPVIKQLWVSSDSASSSSSGRLCLTIEPTFWKPAASWMCAPAGDNFTLSEFCAFIFKHICFPFLCLAIVWPDCTGSGFTRNHLICLSGCESYVEKVTAPLAFMVHQVWCAERKADLSKSRLLTHWKHFIPAQDASAAVPCSCWRNRPWANMGWAGPAGYLSLTLRFQGSRICPSVLWFWILESQILEDQALRKLEPSLVYTKELTVHAQWCLLSKNESKLISEDFLLN